MKLRQKLLSLIVLGKSNYINLPAPDRAERFQNKTTNTIFINQTISIMKKLIYCAAALATALFAGSCQQELLDTPAGENTVTYTVELPDVQTKAIGDGLNVDQLVYEVWKTGEKGELSTRLYQKTINLPADAPRKWIVTLNLVQNQTYKALFWAQVAEAEAYNTDNLTDVYFAKDLTSGYFSNQESYAAFYGTDVLDTNTPLKGKTITLTRPFAQLNIGTLNTALEDEYAIDMLQSSVKVTVPTHFDVSTSKVDKVPAQEITFKLADVPTNPATLPVSGTEYDYVAMNYVFAGENTTSSVAYTINTTITPFGATEGTPATINKTIPNVPLKENYRTNIVGNLLTSSAEYEVVIDKKFNDQADAFDGGKYGVIDGKQYVKTENSEDFTAAVANANVDLIILAADVNLNEVTTRAAADVTMTVAANRTLTIDLNGKTLSATSTQTGKNYNMFDVRGTLNVKNGTIEYTHVGENMLWNNFAEIFYVGFNGTLNLDDVTAVNHGGSDMAYIIDMCNATNITVNVKNSTLKSTYIPVRVFNNSKTGVNNVTIKNSTLEGKYCFWVQYWLADGRDEATLKNTLKLDIFSEENVYVPTGAAPIIYGFNTTYYGTTNGITKSVSEDGTVVTLGTVVENGVVPRYAAGAEEQDIVTTVVVEDGISVLEDRTFRKYYALEKVTLPSTLTALGVAGEQYTSGNIFQGCAKLTNITIPESVTTIGMGTFYGCRSLTSINVPAGVTRIEKDTFRETGLTSIEFHEGVTYFGEYAFRECESLKEIVIKAPSFTVESNTFQNNAAPYPSIKIYVANAEMKDYLETKLSSHENTFITVVAPVETTEGLRGALEGGATLINVAAGEYTFPADYVKAGTTIVCAPGTVFTGTSGLNINGATVVGATFKNEDGTAVKGTINGTLKNCTFVGSEALRWCYTEAGKPVVFENCVIKTDFRGFHFDAMEGDVLFKNCEINGFNAFGGEGTATFENCVFGNDESRYNGLNTYANTVLKDCQFNYISGKTNFIDMEGTGKTLTIENCTATLDGVAVPVIDFVGGSKIAVNTVSLDGVAVPVIDFVGGSKIAVNTVSLDGKACVSYNAENPEGVRYEGDHFESGYMENALWFNNNTFGGEAAIVVENKTYKAIIIENCSGTFKNDVLTIKNDNSSVIILQNLDLTLAEGKKLIKTANPYYQVFMANITINGEKMTQESIAEYLENVAWYQVVEEI